MHLLIVNRIKGAFYGNTLRKLIPKERQNNVIC